MSHESNASQFTLYSVTMLTKLVFFSGGRPVVFLPEASAGLAWRGYRFNSKAVVVGTVPAVVPSASNFEEKKTNTAVRLWFCQMKPVDGVGVAIRKAPVAFFFFYFLRA